MQSLLQAGCHLTSLLLLRAEHCVAPQLLLHLAAFVPEQECEYELGKDDGLGESHRKMRWERTCISSKRLEGRMGGQCSRSP